MAEKRYIYKNKAQKTLIDLPAELDVEAVQRCIEAIHKLPDEDVAPVRHGRWIDKHLDNFRKWESTCSVCGWSGVSDYDSYVDIFDFDFCPHCGAKMDEETKE